MELQELDTIKVCDILNEIVEYEKYNTSDKKITDFMNDGHE